MTAVAALDLCAIFRDLEGSFAWRYQRAVGEPCASFIGVSGNRQAGLSVDCPSSARFRRWAGAGFKASATAGTCTAAPRSGNAAASSPFQLP